MTTRRGQVAAHDGRFDDADRLFEEASTALDRQPESVERAEVASMLYSSWGANAQRRGKLDQAEALIRTGLEVKRYLRAAHHPRGDESAMRVTLGAIQSARGDIAGAFGTFETAYRNHRDAGFTDTLEHLALLGWLGISLDRLGRAGEAEPYMLEAVALAEKLFPQPNSRLSGSYSNLGRLYLNQGRLADAGPLLHKALEVSQAAGESNTPNHVLRVQALGLLAAEAERGEEAVALLSQALSLSEVALGPAHARTLGARFVLLLERANLGARPPLLGEVQALLSDAGKAPFHTEAALLAARVAAEEGDRAAAESAMREAEAALADSPPGAPELPKRRWLQGLALLALGQPDAARDAFVQSASLYEASARAVHPGRGRALLQAALLSPAGSQERARLGSEARDILERQLQPPAASLALLEQL